MARTAAPVLEEPAGELRSLLQCPACTGPLEEDGSALRCASCGDVYPVDASGRPDLRSRRPLEADVRLVVEPNPTYLTSRLLAPSPDPGVDLAEVDVPLRLDARLITYFPCALPPGAPMLDLACGSTHHRPVCEATGHRYVGVDFAESMQHATVLADGRFLPFRDRTFGFVLSVATLEHIPHPELMVREVHRVLRPGGRFVGTTAFLEPEHDGSYFHMSRLGVERLLRDAGFDVVVVAPVPRWSVLDAQARMSLFPRLPGRLSRALVAPLKALHVAWWWIGGRIQGSEGSSRAKRMFSTAGAICFVADKRAAPGS